MKHFLTILITLTTGFFSHATVITVSNNPVTAGQYTDLAVAYAAAGVGDTLYVHGSPITYCPGGLTINKRITLIGAGYNDSIFYYNTVVGSIILDSIPYGTSATGTNIFGINANSVSGGSHLIENINLQRCYFLSATLICGNGWVIQNCIGVGGFWFGFTPIANCIIRNNFIWGAVFGWVGGYYSTIIGPGIIIDHNVITGRIDPINYATVSNNIFFAEDFSTFSVNYCNFLNNMCLNATSGVFPSGTNYGSGNVSATFPTWQFVNTLTSSPASLSIIESNDWHLRPTSLGHNAATDGTDMGMYGGIYPMNLTGNTTLPQMTLMNINNPNIFVDSPLHVHFKARKHN